MLLTQYLAGNRSKKEMYQVVLQITEALMDAEGRKKQVRLNLEEMKIENGKVVIQLEETQRPNSILRIADFVKEIVFRSVFQFGEDVEDLPDFLRFLDNERTVTLFYIYEYVMDELNLDIPAIRQMQIAEAIGNMDREKAKVAGQYAGADAQMKQGDFAEPYAGEAQVYQQSSTQANETGVLDVNFWQQNKLLQRADQIQQHSQKLSRQPGSGYGQPQNGIDQSANLGDETGVLDPSFWERSGVRAGGATASRVSRRQLYLVNVKSGEPVQIQKDLFLIGKEAGACDLVIPNKTISRRHAQISVQGDHYFLMDCDSTNKTYVEGRAIQPNVKIEIFSGNKLKFSDEIFEFIVQ